MGEWADYRFGAQATTTTTPPEGLKLRDFGVPDPQDMPGWVWGHVWPWVSEHPFMTVFFFVAGLVFLVVKGFRHAVYGR